MSLSKNKAKPFGRRRRSELLPPGRARSFPYTPGGKAGELSGDASCDTVLV